MADPRLNRMKSLEALAGELGVPADPIVSSREGTLVLPKNVICFQHHSAASLNQPQAGRALHHRFVLAVAIRGGATVCVDDREVRLAAGEALLVFPFQFHHYTDQDREDLLWLFVTFEVQDFSLLEPLRFRTISLSDKLLDDVAAVVETYLGKRNNDLLVLRLGLLLADLRRLDDEALSSIPASSIQGVVPHVNLYAQSAEGPPSVKEIADSLGISVSHLRASFRASCGISLGRHLRRMRLEEACRLLLQTRKSVSEIADACSFNSVDSFSRSFRSMFGISPLAYRKKAGADRHGHASTS